MPKYTATNPDKKYHGLAIFFLTLLGMLFYPAYPDMMSLKWTLRMAAVMLIIMFFVVRFVRRATNQERLFDRRFTWSSKAMQLSVIAIVLVYLVMYVVNGNVECLGKIAHLSANKMASCVFVALGAGVFEEYLVRGYFFNLFQRIFNRYDVKKHRLLYVSFVTSLLFGCLHFTNFGQGPNEAIFQQVFYATCFGLLFAAIRILSNTIWAGAILHFLFDLQDSINDDLVADSWGNVLLMFVPVAIIAVIVIVLADKKVQSEGVQELEA
ncbi:CPBP family intramembrane metalloprotease [Fructobacillus sp. M2-14]|uniref:CPBP family intramembrane metalloprotease n=1 Tax=Fructobacillus broussonetiae TaxID=2713173 RepID=A0ABS5R0Z4_9LACO|nr:CPBP family intramembrane glutamic endopeptidase [Fructobacillus broussonetiae]MBS9339114.1 CPBP family intramembrane metalloprotease [Fructobacillus broussonetiae]